MFWRDMGWNDEVDAVDAREGVCNMTDMLGGRQLRGGQAARPEASPMRAGVSNLRRRPGGVLWRVFVIGSQRRVEDRKGRWAGREDAGRGDCARFNPGTRGVDVSLCRITVLGGERCFERDGGRRDWDRVVESDWCRSVG